jgi:hypothetical protein
MKEEQGLLIQQEKHKQRKDGTLYFKVIDQHPSH